MGASAILRALRAAITSVLYPYQNEINAAAVRPRRHVIEQLESRQLLNADWISVISSSDPPQQIWEGESAGASYEFDTTTPYLLYNVHYDDGRGGASDSWSLSGGGGATYDDNAGYSLSLDLMEDQGWSMQSVWHQDWNLDVENVAPYGTLSTGVGDDEDGLLTMTVSNVHDPSQADRDAGFRFAWGYDYAQLEYNWDNNRSADSSYSFDPSLDADQQYYFRVGDKDGGHSDYSSTLGALPTINWLANANGAIRFAWSDFVSGEQNWVIQRAPFEGTYQTIATLGANRTSYTDKTVIPGQRYQYRLRATGGGVDTAWSAKRLITAAVPTPTGVIASNVNNESHDVVVSWSAPACSYYQGFYVYAYDVDDSSNSTPIESVHVTNGSLRSATISLGAASSARFAVQADGPGGGDSPATEPVENWTEPGAAWMPVYYVEAPYQPHDFGTATFEWVGEDLQGGGTSQLNGQYRIKMSDLPRHTYLSGWLEFVMPGPADDPNVSFTAETDSGDELDTIHFDTAGTNPGWVYDVSFRSQGTDDDALKHDSKSITVIVTMHGLPEDPQTQDFYAWDLTQAVVKSYFPFVSIYGATDVPEEDEHSDVFDGQLTLERLGAFLSQTVMSEALPIDVTYDGYATPGADFDGPKRVSIAAGQFKKDFFNPIDDLLVEGTETSDVYIVQAPDRYKIVDQGKWSIGILDNDYDWSPGGDPRGRSGGGGGGNGGPPPPPDGPPPDDPGPGNDGSGGIDDPGTSPMPPTTPDPTNFVNLVIGGWEGFWGWYGWPYGYASTINTYGTSGHPGVPPTNQSVYLGVNDDFDEQNHDADGNPLPDNLPDATDGDRVDQDVSPMWIDLWSNVYHDNNNDGHDDNPGSFTLTFPSNVKIWRQSSDDPADPQWVPMTSGQSINVEDWYNQSYGGWYWAWGPGFLVEGLSPSSSLHGTNVTATFTKSGAGDASDTVRFSIVQADVDVDSDNNNGTDAPDRGDNEDNIEQQYDPEDPTYPGKIITVNDDDTDGDGIPDFADGFNLDGESSDTLTQLDDQVVAEHFAPVVLDLPAPIDLTKARVYISYYGSDPLPHNGVGGVTTRTDPNTGLTTYTPEWGALRLWMQDGDQSRDGSGVNDGGDYVTPGQWYDWSDLGGSRQLTLWMEAIQPSSYVAENQITMWVDPDGSGPAWAVSYDQVRTTFFKTQLFNISSSGTLSPTDYAQTSYPTPVFSGVSISISNLRRSPDLMKILGDIQVSGVLDDAASDLIPGPEGQIASVELTHNGATLIQIGTNSTKNTNLDSILKPYDFSASFSTTLTGVELDPGINQFHLSATNAYGLSGFAEQSIEVLADSPPDQTYEYEIRMADDPYSNSTMTIELRTRVSGGTWGVWRTLGRDDFDSFSESSGARVDMVLNGPVGNELWATLADPGTEDLGQVLKLTLDRTENVGGVNKNVLKGSWTRQEHDLTNLSGYALHLGQVSSLKASRGGEFHPVAMGIAGPLAIQDLFDSVSLADQRYVLVTYKGKLVFVNEGSSVPRAFLSTLNMKGVTGQSPLGNLPKTAPAATGSGGVLDFSLGFGAGFLWTVPANVIGLWDGVKFAAKEGLAYTPLPVGYRLITRGDVLTIEDRHRVETAKGVAAAAASVLWKLWNDGSTLIDALEVGDDDTINALGEEYRVALEYGAEMIEAIGAQIANMPAYDKGKIMGRIVGEIVLTIALSAASGGGALAAKGEMMANVATKLKQVEFLQPFVTKFDELITFYNKITASGICFIAGTAVWTRDGLKAIEQVRAGDFVLSRNERSREQGYRRVIETFVTHPDRLFRLTYVSAAGEQGNLVCTGEHPFYLVGRENFVPAKELHVGEQFSLADGTRAKLVAVELQFAVAGETFTTYNFEVDGWHTYFVGHAGVWVHNSGATCQRVASVIYRLKERENLDDWRAFERFLEVTNTANGRNAVDPHLVQAAYETMSNSYKKAADILRADPTKIDEALALVPKHSRIDEIMYARRRPAAIESHHTAPKEWAEQLLRNTNRPEYQNLTEAQWKSILDDMPAYLMDSALHRGTDETIPRIRDLTRIIDSHMRGADGSNTQQLLDRLQAAYVEWEAEFGGGDDMWLVARAWLKKKGVQ